MNFRDGGRIRTGISHPEFNIMNHCSMLILFIYLCEPTTWISKCAFIFVSLYWARTFKIYSALDMVCFAMLETESATLMSCRQIPCKHFSTFLIKVKTFSGVGNASVVY